MRHIQPQICQHGFVVLFFLLSLPGKGADSQTPGYTLSAQSVSVASGLCVEIPCTFTVPAGRTLSTRFTGIWHKKTPKIKKETPDIVAASTEASKVSKGTKGRFTLTGKVQEGDCSFSISNAQPCDQGEYVFRIEDGDHKYSYSSYRLSVTVTGTNRGVNSKGADGKTPGYTLCAQRSVSVASGLCVEIPCTFTVPASRTLSTRVTGIWRRTYTPYVIVASTEASMVSEGTKGRFTLTGKVQEGDCSFSISNAQPADRGEYEFRIEGISHKYSYSRYKLSVNVTDLPEPTISPVGEQIAGKPITLTCTAHPAPQGCKGIITWGGRINIESIYNYEREDQAGKVTSISDITVTPSQREHNSPLTCTVTYSGVSTNSSITLGVQYAPKSPTISNCTSAGCRVEVIEGTSLSLLCSAESNPPANLSWAKTGQSSTDPLNSSSGRLDVSHVTTDNGGDYMCRARNKHGNSTASITVVIISLTNDTIQITGLVFCGIFVLLLAAIVITLMMKYKKKRRPPEQIEESKSSSPNYYEVVYSNRERRSDQEPSMSPNSPNEGESPDEDVQYVSLQFSKLKPKISSELQETLYSEVKRN